MVLSWSPRTQRVLSDTLQMRGPLTRSLATHGAQGSAEACVGSGCARLLGGPRTQDDHSWGEDVSERFRRIRGISAEPWPPPPTRRQAPTPGLDPYGPVLAG
jgi:hypothetical protein